MPNVSVRADLMPKEIRREVSRLEKRSSAASDCPSCSSWLLGWLDKSGAGTTLGWGQWCASTSRTRPGSASAPSLCLFWPAHAFQRSRHMQAAKVSTTEANLFMQLRKLSVRRSPRRTFFSQARLSWESLTQTSSQVHCPLKGSCTKQKLSSINS